METIATPTVTVAEACLHLRLTREQVIRRIQTKQLAGDLVGGRWVVEASALVVPRASGALQEGDR